jgi:hypothetical protein
MVELNSEELRELLGAYALDAVDDDERVEVERFLSSDARARAEVAEFRELASFMANAGGDAPVGVWDRITSSIHGDVPALAPVQSPVRIDAVRRRRQSWSLRVAAVIAAVAAAAAAVLGPAGALQRAYDAARLDGSARTAVLTEPQGATGARVVLLPDGNGYFAGEHLGVLAKGLTYQLWVLVGDPANPTAISAGVLGPSPRLAAFRYHGPAIAFAVTTELDPGVVKSQNQPVAVGKIV